MYQAMMKSRELESRIKTIYFEGKTPVFNMAKGPIPGEMHLSVGTEPCAVCVCAHLRPSDFVTTTHRPHHVSVAKGVVFLAKSRRSSCRGGWCEVVEIVVLFE